MKYYEISPVISSQLAVFPGDLAFTRNISFDYDKGDNLHLSSICTTLHIGAHADSSLHYNARGEGIEKRPVDPYYGDCQVLEVFTVADTVHRRIYPSDLKEKINSSRILFKTNSFPNPYNWNSDFFSLSPELIEFLAKSRVQLVGIDTPSVDPEDSKLLECHQSIFKHEICILEGLVLDQVPVGKYHLVALPLRIEGADASPVRAILFAQ